MVWFTLVWLRHNSYLDCTGTVTYTDYAGNPKCNIGLAENFFTSFIVLLYMECCTFMFLESNNRILFIIHSNFNVLFSTFIFCGQNICTKQTF